MSSKPTAKELAKGLQRYAQRQELREEIQRLISIHGADTVKLEVLSATKPSLGRKPVKDLPLLAPYFERDARDWLAGRNPQAMRKNKAIARELARLHPRPNVEHDSMVRHFERRLRLTRKRFMLYRVLEMTECEHPYSLHLQVFEELKSIEDGWEEILQTCNEIVAHYRALYGEPPPSLTWSEIKSKPKHANALAAWFGPKDRGG